jgi:hypothetical protein
VKCVFQAVMGLKKKGIQIFDQEISRGEVTWWSRRKLKDNNKINFSEIGYERKEWTELAQDNAQWWTSVTENLEPLDSIKAGNFLNGWITINFQPIVWDCRVRLMTGNAVHTWQ